MGNKKFGKEEEDATESFSTWIFKKVRTAFKDNIPMEAIKELPKAYMYIFGFIAEAMALLLFCYFVYTGYQQEVTSEFMSLDNGAGNCEDVSQPLSGTYLADTSGNWEGTSDFSYNLAIYQFTFSAFEGDDSTFYSLMSFYESQMDELSIKTSTSNVAFVLVLWITFGISLHPEQYGMQGGVQKMSLTGDAGTIFDTEYILSAMGNVDGDCNETVSTNFQLAGDTLDMSYSYKAYMSTPVCANVINPSLLGYNAILNEDNFIQSIDARTLTFAFSVNSGLVDIGELEVVVGSTQFPIAFGTSYFLGQYYINPRNPGMKPVFCFVSSTDSTTLCTIFIGRIIALPLFNTFGASSTLPVYCDCDNPATADDTDCDLFNYMTGYMYFPNSGSGSTITASSLIAVLSAITSVPYSTLNKAAFNASYAVTQANNPNADPIMKTQAWREKAFQFCNSSTYGSCSISMWHMVDTKFKSTSLFSYQLLDGSCSNESTAISSSSWEKLKSNPPVPLVQDYLKCTSEPFVALFDAVGIAGGNAGLLVPLICFLLLPLTYMWLQCIGHVPPKTEYGDTERGIALEAFITQILRSRDGKTRDLKSKGIIVNLTKELVLAARHEGGYPDSDDSDDEEDDDSKSGNSKSFLRAHYESSLHRTSSDSVRDKFYVPKSAVFVTKESFNGMEQRRQQRKSTHGSSRNLKRYSNVRRERLYSAENPMGMGAVAMTNLHRYNHRSSTSHAEILMFKDDNYEEDILILNVRRDYDKSVFPVANPKSVGETSAESVARAHPTLSSFYATHSAIVGICKQKAPVVSYEEAMMILEDLKRLFALALKDQLSGQDSEEDTNYQAACSLVLKLQNVNLRALYDKDSKKGLHILHGVLCMHASMALGIDPSEIDASYANKVSYCMQVKASQGTAPARKVVVRSSDLLYLSDDS